MKPLEGYKVLDLTHVLAGPYCTYQLHLLGAEVTKVESPRGDMVRIWGGTDEELAARVGTGFVPQNAGKRSLCIDLNKPEAQDIVRRLAAEADIMVENYEPGTMQKFGLDYDSVRQLNEQIIYLSISAFGQTGPNAGRPGFDDVVQATSGYMSINIRGDGPIRTGGPVLDYATGMQGASAVMAAILQKAKTGEGQYIDLAMQDVTLLLINRNTSIAATTGEPAAAPGNRDAPMLGRYQSADGYLMLAGYFPAHCKEICRAIGLETFADLPSSEFRARIDEIDTAVEAKLIEKTSAEWDAVFKAAGVVAGGVQDLKAVLDSGHLHERELISEVASPAGTHQVTTAGYRISDAVFGPEGAVPGLGEHSRAVLVELGFTDVEIDALDESGVIYS